MTVKERRAKRALHKAQRELAAYHQNRLSVLETVRAQGLTAFAIIISVVAVLLPASRLSADEAQFVVFAASVGAFGIVALIISSAQNRAREIRGDYLRDHVELFGDIPAPELVSWLLERPRKSKPAASRKQVTA